MYALILFLICLVTVILVFTEYYCLPRTKKIIYNNTLKTEELMKFSDESITEVIHFYLRFKSADTLNFDLDNYEKFRIEKGFSKKRIKDTLERYKVALLSEIPSVNKEGIGDAYNKKMLKVWLEYGYRNDYRVFYRRLLNELFEANEISLTMLNQMTKRFYKFII